MRELLFVDLLHPVVAVVVRLAITESDETMRDNLYGSMLDLVLYG